MKYFISIASLLLLLVFVGGYFGCASTDLSKDPVAMESAKSIEGEWLAQPGDIKLVFKIDGTNLSGTLDNPAQAGVNNLSRFNVSGKTVTFSLERSFGSVDWKGEITGGDEIKFKRTWPNGADELTATRVK